MKLAQIALTVEDVAGLTRYYRDVLGLQVLLEQPKLAILDAGGVRVLLSGSRPGETNPDSIVYYRVDDLASRWNELLSKGAESVSPPHVVGRLPDREIHIGMIRDPEGRLVGIMSEVQI